MENSLEKEQMKFFYRQDKYNYKELTESITKNTLYQWRRVYVRETKTEYAQH